MDRWSQAGMWPLRSGLSLGAQERAVPCARLHARLVVAEWGLPALVEAAELVVSELVSNSLRSSHGLDGYRYQGAWRAGTPPLRLGVWSDGRRVLVQVWDAAEGMPVRRQPPPDDEHGRGLLLVEHLSEARGVYRLAGTSGKVTWAVVGRGRA
jgi:histidine kinase-like protein